MSDFFRTVRRRPVLYRIGSFDDGRPRYAKAPFDVLSIKVSDSAPHETVISTHGTMAETTGLSFGTNLEDDQAFADRDGLGWIEENIVTEEHLCGAWEGNDNLFAWHRFAPL